jgi:uncharacterized membrane protein HdeD (DUF308 family)
MRLTTSPATARLIVVGIMMVIAGVAEVIKRSRYQLGVKFFSGFFSVHCHPCRFSAL